MRRLIFLAGSAALVAAIGGLLHGQRNPVYPLRWVRIASQLQSDEDVEKVRRIARTAGENGLNGALMAIGLDSIDLKGPEYLRRLEEVKAILKENRLEMIPNIFSGGYGGAILAHDRNLAEGFEVRDLLYTVKGGEGAAGAGSAGGRHGRGGGADVDAGDSSEAVPVLSGDVPGADGGAAGDAAVHLGRVPPDGADAGQA
jgi:hypothetical protein